MLLSKWARFSGVSEGPLLAPVPAFQCGVEAVTLILGKSPGQMIGVVSSTIPFKSRARWLQYCWIRRWLRCCPGIVARPGTWRSTTLCQNPREGPGSGIIWWQPVNGAMARRGRRPSSRSNGSWSASLECASVDHSPCSCAQRLTVAEMRGNNRSKHNFSSWTWEGFWLCRSLRHMSWAYCWVWTSTYRRHLK